MTASDLPEPTPEGALIRLARERRIPKLSIRDAATEAGMSPENWGNVERGYQSQGKNREPRPVIPPRDTLARMALIARASPDELEHVHREDAADVLRQMLAGTSSNTGSRFARWLGEEMAARHHQTGDDAIASLAEQTGLSLAESSRLIKGQGAPSVGALRMLGPIFGHSLGEMMVIAGLAEPDEIHRSGSVVMSGGSGLVAAPTPSEPDWPEPPDHPPPDMEHRHTAAYADLSPTRRWLMWTPGLTPRQRVRLIGALTLLIDADPADIEDEGAAGEVRHLHRGN